MSAVTEWHETRLKNLFTSVRNGIWGDDPDDETDVFCARGTDFDRVKNRISDSKMPRRSVAPSGLRDHELVRGDLVLEKSGGSADQPVGSVALFDLQTRAVCSNFNARMQVSSSVDSRFVCYLMNGLYWSGFTRQFVKQTTGIQNLDAEAFLSQHCKIPPIDEQRRIAEFLDGETAQIDQILHFRRSQMALLDGRESSLLDEAYTAKGSEEIRLKHLSSRITSGPRGWGDLISDEGTPFLRIMNIPRRGVRLELSDLARVAAPCGAERERTRTRAGDVLVSITADIGSVGVIDNCTADGNVSQHIALVRPIKSLCDSDWLAYAIKSPAAKRQLASNSYGGAKAGLGLGEIGDLRLPALTLATQQRVALRINEMTRDSEFVREAVMRQIALLTERRHALIVAAVMGQIDVTAGQGLSLSGGAAV
ncbi:hypothetical protein ACFVUY_03860 [Kitasatospora sp. NPDC058063]|uniref:hypothetical protein n=1 Tax=unclassified Kitasatospora TaxID=2633591 RepID=UPI0036DBEFCB